MLQYSAVRPELLHILKQLMAIPELKNFCLVGGTNLSLKYGHRISVDIDLFSTENFENAFIIDVLEKYFDNISYRSDDNPVGVFCFINGVKVDLVKHYYFGLIDSTTETDGIRMFGDKDIIAMKVFAILKRAQKKDFWDIAELLKHYPISNFVDCYKNKYPGNQVAISIPYAISYFADAEESETPISLKGQTWESVKKSIQKAVSDYLK